MLQQCFVLIFNSREAKIHAVKKKRKGSNAHIYAVGLLVKLRDFSIFVTCSANTIHASKEMTQKYFKDPQLDNQGAICVRGEFDSLMNTYKSPFCVP